MGGSKGNRVKGNAKPSSSGRAANLFFKKDSITPLTFQTFSSLQNGEVENEIDPQLNNIIRRLSKKDSITKIKALQELLELGCSKSDEEICSILTIWCRAFSKLAMDNDFQVREITLKTHAMIIKKVGKKLALHLKQIIFPWLVCLYDPYLNVSEAAQKAFEISFPGHKFVEVLSFCHDEILKNSDEIIFRFSTKALDGKNISAQELEDKVTRVFAGAFHVTTLLIEKFQEKEDKMVFLQQHMNTLLENDLFWKYGNDKIKFVRASWFNLIFNLCIRFKNVLPEYRTKLIKLSFDQLSEENAVLSQAVLKCAFLLMETFPDCFKDINFETTLLPQIRKILKNGAYSSVQIFYSNCRLFIERIIITYPLNDKFFITFFEEFRVGMRQKELHFSDYAIMIDTYLDCFKYVESKKNEFQGIDLEKIVQNDFGVLIKERLNSKSFKTSAIMYKSLANFLTSISDSELLKFCLNQIADAFSQSLSEQQDLSILLEQTTNLLSVFFYESYFYKKLTEGFYNKNATPDQLQIDNLKFSRLDCTKFESLIQKMYESVKERTDLFSMLKYCIFFRRLIEIAAELNIPIDITKITSLLYSGLAEENEEVITSLMSIYFIWITKRNLPLNDLEALLAQSSPKINSAIFKYLKVFGKYELIKDFVNSEKLIIIFDQITQKHLVNKSQDSFKQIEQLFDLDLNTEQVEIFLQKLSEMLEMEKSNAIELVICSIKQIFCNERLYPTLAKNSILFQVFSICFQTKYLKFDFIENILDLIPIILREDSFDQTIFLNKIGDEISKVMHTDLNDMESIDLLSEKICILLDKINKCKKQNLLVNMLQHIFLQDKDFNELYGQLNHSLLLYPWMDSAIFEIPLTKLEPNLKMDKFLFISVFLAKILVFLTNDNSSLANNHDLVDVISNQIPHLCIAAAYSQITMSFREFHVEGETCFFELMLQEFDQFIKQSDAKVWIKANNYKINNSLLQLWTNIGLQLAFKQHKEKINLSFDPSSKDFCINHFLLFTDYFNTSDKVHYLDDCIAFNMLNLANNDCDYHELASFEAIVTRLLSVIEEKNSFDVHITPLFESILRLSLSTNLNQINDDKYLEYVANSIDLLRVIFARHHKKFLNEWFNHLFNLVLEWTSFLPNLNETSLNNLYLLNFLKKLFKLIKQIHEIIEKDFEIENLKKAQNEWNTVYAHQFIKNIFTFFVNIKNHSLIFTQQTMYKDMAEVLVHLDNDEIIKQNIYSEETSFTSSKVKLTEYCLIDDKLKQLFSYMQPMFTHSNPINRFIAYRITTKYLSKLENELSVTSLLDLREEILLQPPDHLMHLLYQTDNIVHLLLADFTVGECICIVQPYKESYNYTMAYLLGWLQLLKLFGKLSFQHRPQMLAYLKEYDYPNRLLNNLFRLMPFSADDHRQFASSIQHMFIKPFIYELNELPGSNQMQHLACQVYLLVLQRLPAVVRLWSKSKDRRLYTQINQFTQQYASPVLISKEINSVLNFVSKTYKSLTFRTRPQLQEVIASYAVEEIYIELSIKLPKNHPLEQVEIDGGKRVGVDVSKWRTWLLQLTTFLSQNGSVLDGVELWANNLSKRFDGVDECMICFYILHNTNFQLPRISCKVCKTKFHSACLFKWLKTSEKRNCPLCRSEF